MESSNGLSRSANRSMSWDSRNKWRTRAQWRGKMLKQAQLDLVQALADYDEVEAELRTWLKAEDGLAPNPNLLAMDHIDLAILADQYRLKYMTLLEGGGHHGTAQAMS